MKEVPAHTDPNKIREALKNLSSSSLAKRLKERHEIASPTIPNIQIKHSANKGFTLIELMITVSIIALLATIGIVIYAGAQAKVRDAKRKDDLESIKKAFYMFATSENKQRYCTSETTAVSYGPTSPELTQKLVSNYIPEIPRDPTTSETVDYLIYLDCPNNSFILSTLLEDDPPVGLTCNPNPAGGTSRNYCITN